MKKLFIFIAIVVVGYLVYDNFIKEKKVVQIKASYTSRQEISGAEAPAISPRVFAHYEGTVKNISGKILNNLVITYVIDGHESEFKISKLSPGEKVDFKTGSVLLQHINPYHNLKSVVYDKE